MIEKIIGPQNVAMLRTAHLGGRFELYRFINKSLLSGKDVRSDFLDDSGAYMLKALVGDDQLDAEKKGGGSFSIRGNYNVIITANTRLKIRIDSDKGAWRRRLLIVEYQDRPAPIKTVPNYADILVREEGAGIVNWMVEGLVKLLREADQYGKIRLTPLQEQRIESLLMESDSVREFVRSCVVRAPANDITVNEVVTAYIRFCQSRGWAPLPIRQVERALPDVMIAMHQATKSHDIGRGGKAHRGYANLSIRNENMAA